MDPNVKHRCWRKANNSTVWQTGWFQFCFRSNTWIKFERKKVLPRGIEPWASQMTVFRSTEWAILYLIFIVLYLDVGSSNILLDCGQPCMCVEMSPVHPAKLGYNYSAWTSGSTQLLQ
jgi:hypothetical protein